MLRVKMYYGNGMPIKITNLLDSLLAVCNNPLHNKQDHLDYVTDMFKKYYYTEHS